MLVAAVFAVPFAIGFIESARSLRCTRAQLRTGDLLRTMEKRDGGDAAKARSTRSREVASRQWIRFNPLIAVVLPIVTTKIRQSAASPARETVGGGPNFFRIDRKPCGFCRDKKGGSNKCRYNEDYLSDQRIEPLGRNVRDPAVFHLAFDDHVQELNAAQNDACTTKTLETQDRSRSTLDSTAVLLDDVVQVFLLANPDRCLTFSVERL